MRRDAGTIFIETMIAAAIVAMMLAGLYQAMASGAARHRMSEARRVALMMAQSQLAAAGVQTPLTPGRTSTVEGDYVSQVEVSPWPGAADSKAGALSLVTVSVHTISDPRPLVSLRSLRLAPATP